MIIIFESQLMQKLDIVIRDPKIISTLIIPFRNYALEFNSI